MVKCLADECVCKPEIEEAKRKEALNGSKNQPGDP